MARRKTWKEKYETAKEPKIVDDPRGRGKMLIPTPALVDRWIKKIPEGKLATVDQIREALAREFGVDFTCPLATGWFVKIIAGKTEDELKEGIKEVSPYWRVVKKNGSLLDKKPEIWKLQASRLEKEGHELIYKGEDRPPVVKDFRSKLVQF